MEANSGGQASLVRLVAVGEGLGRLDGRAVALWLIMSHVVLLKQSGRAVGELVSRLGGASLKQVNHQRRAEEGSIGALDQPRF